MSLLPSVLLIDDDPTTNFLNERLLHRLKVSDLVLTATNGQRGLDLLQERCQGSSPDCPSLVLLDMHMPVMNGLEFLEAMFQLPLSQRRDIVVVMLTSSQLDKDFARFQHLPVTDFLTKPLTPAKIESVVSRYFGNTLSDN